MARGSQRSRLGGTFTRHGVTGYRASLLRWCQSSRTRPDPQHSRLIPPGGNLVASKACAETGVLGTSRGDRFAGRAERRSNIAALIPRDWQLERGDVSRPSNRFVSPGGTAWLAFYARSTEDETREERFKAVAFADD